MPLPLAGARVKAGDLAAIFPLGVDAYTPYTPTLTQSATVTKTVVYAAYMKVGRQVTCNVLMTVTGAGTAGNAVLIGLPVAPASSAGQVIGSGFIFDASVPIVHAGAVALNGGVASFFVDGSNGALAGAAGGIFTAGLALNDQLRISLSYEAAS